MDVTASPRRGGVEGTPRRLTSPWPSSRRRPSLRRPAAGDLPSLRRQILGSGMPTKMWEVTVEHAKTCILTDKTEAHAAVKQAYENWKNVLTCDNEILLENPSHLFDMRSPSLHENEYNQFPTQVATDGFGLSHSDIPSADIFSVEPSSALDPCALETAESNENRFQSELPPLGGHGPPQESLALDKFSNSLVYEECTSHPSFNEDYYRCADPTVSFDTQDLGAALKGFISTISKPRAYRGWRTLSSVIGWIFYTKKIVALKRKKPGK